MNNNFYYDHVPHLYFAFLFLWGACTGSFLNVLIYRYPRGMSLLTPPSQCLSCGSEVGLKDLCPILGWFWLKGKCRHCSTKISFRYPLIELITALLCGTVGYLNAYNDYGTWTNIAVLLFHLFFITIMIAIFFIDLDTTYIPDALSINGLSATIVFSAIAPEIHGFDFQTSTGNPAFFGLNRCLYGILAGGGAMYALRRFSMLAAEKLSENARNEDQEIDAGICMGDIKLMTFAGASLGWERALLALGLGLILCAIHGLTQNFTTGEWPKEANSPFTEKLKHRFATGSHVLAGGPSLATASVIMLFWGEPLARFIFV